MNKYLYLTLTLLILYSGLTAQDWTAISSLPSGKHHPVTFAIDGVGYAFTGWDAVNGPSRDAYKYDPSNDTWSTLPQFSGAARSYAIGYAYNGKGYLGFGATETAYLADIWEFDPMDESWSLLTVCPCDSRRHPAFLMDEDKIYVGLGDGQIGNMNDWWQYDMVEDEWTQLPNIPALQRHHPYQFTVNGELYVGLGHGGPNIFNDWFHFDQSNNTWETLNNFPAEARVAGTQFNHGDYGYILSGDGSDHSYMEEGEFWQYDPSEDSWEQFPSHPGNSLWAPGSFVIGDTLYFLGGQNRATGIIQSNAWKFQLPTPEPPSAAKLIADLSEIRVFPSPADDVVYFDSPVPIQSVELFNLSGQLVLKNTHSPASLTVSELSAGVYMAKIKLMNGEQKLLKWMKA